MISSDFVYVLKSVLLSPVLIGVTIFSILILSFVFYVMSYKKRSRKFLVKKEKFESKKEEISIPNEEQDTEVYEDE